MQNCCVLLIQKNVFAIVCLISGLLLTAQVQAAPTAELLSFWVSSNEKNDQGIDHSAWQATLDHYLISEHSSGINRFDYKRVSRADKKRLADYLLMMQKLDPRHYAKATQKAYWINLYNALTVKLILDHYPVSSITEISEGFFSFGPWDDKVITLQGQALSLNDIEHGILRPQWKDNRIHYAVNCASMSCPNLSALAFTANNTENLLEQSASDYINHSRGVKFENGKLVVSSIYHWYKIDFGNSDASLLLHLQQYAKAALKEELTQYQGKLDHDYSWVLNQP
ncbi:MAG: DUF547 domain-containing protein [Spongiibacteraceae bacterium]|nr:DUF547 domain-containing protein [Spongiibacteraceae bacterium]